MFHMFFSLITDGDFHRSHVLALLIALRWTQAYRCGFAKLVSPHLHTYPITRSSGRTCLLSCDVLLGTCSLYLFSLSFSYLHSMMFHFMSLIPTVLFFWMIGDHPEKYFHSRVYLYPVFPAQYIQKTPLFLWIYFEYIFAEKKMPAVEAWTDSRLSLLNH